MEKYAELLGKVVYGKKNWFYVYEIEDVMGDDIYLNTYSSRHMDDFTKVWNIKRLQNKLKPPTEEVKQTVLRIIFQYA